MKSKKLAKKPVKTTPKAKPTIRFIAKLESSIALPKGVITKLQSQLKAIATEKIVLEGAINSLPFQSSIESDDKGNYKLVVNKSMHSFAMRGNAEMIPIEITKIGNEIETRIPTEFQKALAKAPEKVRDLWVDITPLARRDWIFWIITAKQEETRDKRARVACSKLGSGMRRVCCFPGIKWIMKKGIN